MRGFTSLSHLRHGATGGLLGEGDLLVLDGPGGPRLMAFTLEGAALLTYRIDGSGDLSHRDTDALDDTPRIGVAPQLAVVGDHAMTAGLGLGTGGGHRLLQDGRTGSGDHRASAMAPDLGAVAAIEAHGTAFAYALRPGENGIRGYEVGVRERAVGNATLAIGETYSTLATATVDGQPFVLAGSLTGDHVTALRITRTGALEQADRVGAPNGLGLSDPSAIAVTEAGGATYVIVAGSGSSSLSVLRLHGSGALQVVDHLLDDRDTRFAHITEIEVLRAGERTFLAVAGSDDGVTLLALLPGGRLQVIDTVEDTTGVPLTNVSALAGWVDGGDAVLWALSGVETGLAEIRVDLGDPGRTWTGSDRADTLEGGRADDVLSGGAGNDTIRGGAGDDVLMDGAGRDALWGGAGADTFALGLDGSLDDVRDFDVSEDRLDLSAMPFLHDAAQLRAVQRSWGVELFFGDEQTRIYAAPGTTLRAADLLERSLLPMGRPTLAGIATVVTGGDGSDWIEGGDGPDTLDGGAGDDTLVGALGDDALLGGDGDDRLHGLGGADRLDAGGGRDALYGGAGDDVLIGGGGNDHLDGEAGDDLVQGGGGRDALFGGDGADRLEGGGGRDLLNGGAEADRIDGGGGRDALIGGAGNDTLDGGKHGDTLSGDQGHDLLIGDAGNDHMDGGAHQDTLEGGRGNDTLIGGAGHDSLVGHGGRDVLQGGEHDDTLDGGGKPDTLDGGDGDDRLYGGNGHDRIAGGDDTDLLWGGRGHDALDGGRGRDSLWGDEGDDVLQGGKHGDHLWGGDDDDVLDGAGARDALFGDAGDDRLDGGAGHDLLEGGWGDDTLIGGRGHDRLVGGEGRDRYGFGTGSGRDTVVGFGGGDVVDLSGVRKIKDWADLRKSHVEDVEDGVLVQAGKGLSILLEDRSVADLRAGEFDF